MMMMTSNMVEVCVDGHGNDGGKWETTCWGCNLQLTLPCFEPIFKCGYCGAITSDKSSATKPRLRISPRCNSLLDHFMVTFVLLFVLFIVCGGVWTTFPILFPRASFAMLCHSAFIAFLVFNVLFNFAFAAKVPAGPLPPVEWGKVEVVSRGGLEDYKFCVHCQKPKHPRAHHCSTCRTCILDMDHHCPFIGNCVGANNHGYFILFLIFTTVSCLYVLIMVLYTYTHAQAYWMVAEAESLSERDTLNLGLDLMAGVLSSLLFDNQVTFTIRSIGLLYLFVASLVLLIGVGLLLHQQLVLVYSGQTYLDSISPHMATESDPAGFSGKRGWTNVQRLFGKKNPLLWLLPSLNSKRFYTGKVMSSIL